MNKRSVNRYTIAIFILFLAIAGILAAAALLLPRLTGLNVGPMVNRELVNFPKINSTVYSTGDGSEHSLSVSFTIAVDETSKESIDVDTLLVTMADVVDGLDYDKIREKGGIDYIKTEVIRELDKLVGEDELKGLYIRDINSDNAEFDFSYVNQKPEPSSEKMTVSEFLEALGKRNR